MVDITPPEGISPVPAADQHNLARQRREEGEAEEQPPRMRQPKPRESAHDVAFIMGIPEDELTPQVHEALLTIMNEFDRQRHELEQLRLQIAFLRERADAHPVLPLLNRRALMRELTRTIAREHQTGTMNSFAVFHFRGLSGIHRRHGLDGAEQALVRIAEMFVRELRETDVVGSLGNNELGVILPLAGRDAAVSKARDLSARVGEMAVDPAAPERRLSAVYGTYLLLDTDSADSAFAAADRDLLDHLSRQEA